MTLKIYRMFFILLMTVSLNTVFLRLQLYWCIIVRSALLEREASLPDASYEMWNRFRCVSSKYLSKSSLYCCNTNANSSSKLVPVKHLSNGVWHLDLIIRLVDMFICLWQRRRQLVLLWSVLPISLFLKIKGV